MNDGVDDGLYFEGGDQPLFSVDVKKKNKEELRKRKVQERAWREDFKEVFCNSGPAGRRVLWFLMYNLYVFRSSAEFNAAGYGVLAKQEVGMTIMDIVGAEQVLKSLIAVRGENQPNTKEKESNGK